MASHSSHDTRVAAMAEMAWEECAWRGDEGWISERRRRA